MATPILGEASARHGNLGRRSPTLPPDLTGRGGAAGLATAADDLGAVAGCHVLCGNMQGCAPVRLRSW